MSYSVSVPATPVKDFDAALDAALDGYTWANNPPGEEVARKVAESVKAFVRDGLIAPEDGYVVASISGHANPDRNNEGTGYVRDDCSIRVAQVEAPASVREPADVT